VGVLGVQEEEAAASAAAAVDIRVRVMGEEEVKAFV